MKSIYLHTLGGSFISFWFFNQYLNLLFLISNVDSKNVFYTRAVRPLNAKERGLDGHVDALDGFLALDDLGDAVFSLRARLACISVSRGERRPSEHARGAARYDWIVERFIPFFDTCCCSGCISIVLHALRRT